MSNTVPSLPTKHEDFVLNQEWRERFLKLVLIGSSILGFIALIGYVFGAGTNGEKALAMIACSALILATVLDDLQYRIRAGILLSFLYAAGLRVLLDYGVADASIVFLGFILMTSLLFSARTGLYLAIGVTFITLLLFGWSGSAVENPAISLVIFLVVAIIMGIGLQAFQEQFTKTFAAERQTIETLQTERSTLERQVEERSAGLSRKTEQLRATSYIARKTAEVQDLASLLTTMVHLVTDQFGFYHTGIFLINESGDHAVLLAASSEGGQRMIERGHALAVGAQGIVGYAAGQKKPRIALDVGEDAVFFNNPDLPMTRSEVALPLLIRNKILGVLDIQSDKPQAFSTDDIDVLQTLSDQIAIAIENARLLDETQAAIMQLEALSGSRTREVWTQMLREKNRTFTYTPLGLRAEKLAQSSENSITAPIVLRGQKIGNISIARKGNVKWNKLDEGLLDEVANQVGLAIDNIRLLEEATQRANQEQTIGKLATRFSQSFDLDTLLQASARELAQLPDVSEISVIIGELPDDRSGKQRRPSAGKI